MNNKQLRRELKIIGDRNRRFNKMSPERKQVTIAKDTLAVLKTKKVLAMKGVYLSHTSKDNGDKLPNNYNCNACALGSMFVGLTTRIKDLSVKNHSGFRNSFTAQLAPYFGQDQLSDIEKAFETTPQSYDTECDAQVFGVKYHNDEDRLIGIMENIINNNGTFKP